MNENSKYSFFPECIRRVQKHDVTDVFNINDTREPTAQPEDSSESYQLPPYDPPPAYSSLFPLQKEFNIPVSQFSSSAPSSIFMTTMSGTNQSNSQPLSVITTTTTVPPLSQRNNSFMSTISRISSSINIMNRNSSCNSLQNSNINTTSFGGANLPCRCCVPVVNVNNENANVTNRVVRSNNNRARDSSGNVTPNESSNNLPNNSGQGHRRSRTSSNNENLRTSNSNRNIRTNESSASIVTESSNNPPIASNSTEEIDAGIVISTRNVNNNLNSSHTSQSDA